MLFIFFISDTYTVNHIFVLLSAQYFGFDILLLSLSTSLTIVLQNVYYKGQFSNEVPNVLRVFILDWMARLMCMKKLVDRNKSYGSQV